MDSNNTNFPEVKTHCGPARRLQSRLVQAIREATPLPDVLLEMIADMVLLVHLLGVPGLRLWNGEYTSGIYRQEHNQTSVTRLYPARFIGGGPTEALQTSPVHLLPVLRHQGNTSWCLLDRERIISHTTRSDSSLFLPKDAVYLARGIEIIWMPSWTVDFVIDELEQVVSV